MNKITDKAKTLANKALSKLPKSKKGSSSTEVSPSVVDLKTEDTSPTEVSIPNIDLAAAYQKLSHLNIMVCGKNGVGKSTLISAIFTDEKIETGVGLPVTQDITEYTKEGMPLSIYDCPGFELDNEQRESVLNQIKQTIKDKKIHCMWYCLNVMGSKIEMPEADCIRELRNIQISDGENGQINLPVIIVLTQAFVSNRVEGLINTIRSDGEKGCGLKNIPIVDIIAKEENIDGKKLKPRNLDKLIDVSLANMGKDARDTMISMQMVNFRQKEKKSERIIKATALTSFAVGAAPIPFADAPILAAAETKMIAEITVVWGLDIDKGTLIALVSSALGAGGAAIFGRQFVSWLLKMTGAGAVVGGAFSGSTALILTTTLGEAYIRLMKLVFIGKISRNALIGKEGRKLFKELFKKAMKNKDKSKLLNDIKRKLNIGLN